ncbi:MAG TPA: OmpH family outer membrane protein [Bacteroidales bacterium]|nr:OmpH family outer membrane protein [Bacteroidales bacterium]
MKNVIKSFYLIGLVLLMSCAQAQSIKIGHVDSNAIMNLMPERTQVEKQLEDFQTQLEAELRTMMTEYQKKVTDYQNSVGTMSNLIKQSKEKEITDLQMRIQDFQQNAEDEFADKRIELLKPIVDKVKKAIEDVGKENNYTYIIDASMGVLLYTGTNADDVTSLVKAKLNIK